MSLQPQSPFHHDIWIVLRIRVISAILAIINSLGAVLNGTDVAKFECLSDRKGGICNHF